MVGPACLANKLIGTALRSAVSLQSVFMPKDFSTSSLLIMGDLEILTITITKLI